MGGVASTSGLSSGISYCQKCPSIRSGDLIKRQGIAPADFSSDICLSKNCITEDFLSNFGEKAIYILSLLIQPASL